MGIQTISDNSVVTGSSTSPVNDFLKNPPAKVAPPVVKDTPPIVKEAPLPDSPPTPPPQPTPSSASTPFTEDDRNRIGAKLTAAIGKAVREGELSSDNQRREVCQDVLEAMTSIKTKENLKEALTELVNRWPFLSSVLNEEQSQKKAIQDVDQAFQRDTGNQSTAT